MWMFVVLVFKQKTAYEVRISDWSADVCSSDLSAIAADSQWNRSRVAPLAPDQTDTDSSMMFIIANPETATARSSARLSDAPPSTSVGLSPIGCASKPSSEKAPISSGVSASGVQEICTRLDRKSGV